MIDFRVTGTIQLTSALPDIDDDLTIVGPGRDLLTIDAQISARVFYIGEGVSAEISGLTMMRGYEPDDVGGGIYNNGELVLRNCTILKNIAKVDGGGVYNSGDLRVSDCTISENALHQGDPGRALHLQMRGGGIFNSPDGFLVVNNSVISNHAIKGGFSSLALGAGIANFGIAEVRSSTISGNTANAPETSDGLGGGIFNGGEFLVSSSLISKNAAAGDCYARGGGIANGYPHYLGGKITVINSTITDNVAVIHQGCGNDPTFGGGINSENGGSVTVTHSTIARNHSAGGQGYGGGISVRNSSLHVQNTIVAGNSAKTGADFSGVLTSSGNNLFGESSGGSGYASTDILDVRARLAPLADNGGPTLTIALLPGSPAIDAGNNNDAPEFDQRGPGFPRIVNGTIDIGAFEVQATGAPLARDLLAVLITANFENETFDLRN